MTTVQRCRMQMGLERDGNVLSTSSLLAQAHATNFWGYAAATFQTTEEEHDRWERCTYWTLADAAVLRAAWQQRGRPALNDTRAEEHVFIDPTVDRKGAGG